MSLQATTPTLTGSRILFTEAASPNGGVDVVLSDDLRTNIQKAVDSNCKNIDTNCVDSIKGLLVNPHTELESRQVGPAVAGGAAFLAFIAMVIPLWGQSRDQQGVPVALHIPSAQLDPAASVAHAATIAAAASSGAPFITITPKPDAPAVTGYVSRIRCPLFVY